MMKRGLKLFITIAASAVALQGAAQTTKVFKGQGPIRGVSTVSRPVQRQWKGVFSQKGDDVFFRNDFQGGRLNGMVKLNDTLYTALITSENTPVNSSPWYAFKVWAGTTKVITLKLTYQQGSRHRYPPKISEDGKLWTAVEPGDVKKVFEEDSLPGEYQFKLKVGKDTTWIAAQELFTSKHANAWLDELRKKPKSSSEIIGYSRLGKPLTVVKMGNPKSKKRILVIGRQHPPEVTGQYAMKAFVETLNAGTALSDKFLKEYLVYVIPLMNPDGVDNGNWRHNDGGIDLNRDWDAFNQPESSAVRDFLKKEIADRGNQLIFSIDFHSTQDDIYYRVDPKMKGNMPNLISDWLTKTQEQIPGYVPNVKSLYNGGGTFTAFSYFFKQYGTESLVYEIGDNTPRDFIKHKGEISAEILMNLLLNK